MAENGEWQYFSLSFQGDFLPPLIKLYEDVCMNVITGEKLKHLSQFTGFTDAGGEELYDGDIFEDDMEWYQVGWSKEDGAWYAYGIREKNGNIDMQLSEFAHSSTCWKQGNIYQTELIKQS